MPSLCTCGDVIFAERCPGKAAAVPKLVFPEEITPTQSESGCVVEELDDSAWVLRPMPAAAVGGDDEDVGRSTWRKPSRGRERNSLCRETSSDETKLPTPRGVDDVDHVVFSFHEASLCLGASAPVPPGMVVGTGAGCF